MPTTTDTLTDDQIAYLNSQLLGRLATVRPDGTPQNNPVGFAYNSDLGTIDIGGRDLPSTKKFRNLATNPRVAFVVDDIVSTQPWTVRCLEIRGTAEALADAEPLQPGFGRGLIRIHPDRVLAMGL